MVDGFLTPGERRRLRRDALRHYRAGGFRHAGVGRGASFRIQPEVRNDQVRWLDPLAPSLSERRFLERMEILRQAINQTLFLGLMGFEAHFAVFPPEARYRCHLDQFRNALHRVVSAIVYLNEAWSAADGGALRLYLEEPEAPPYQDVLPLGGRLVCFASGRFHHEVLPAARDRVSVTGWFTTRP